MEKQAEKMPSHGYPQMMLSDAMLTTKSVPEATVID